MPGTLVLRPTAIYAAYLAGYLAAPPGDVFDVHAFDDPEPPAGTLERMTAYALGDHDSRCGDAANGNPRGARELREVLSLVRSMLDGKPAEAPPVAAKPSPEPVIHFTFEGVRYSAPMAFERLQVARLPDGRHVYADAFKESYPPQPVDVRRYTPPMNGGYVDAELVTAD